MRNTHQPNEVDAAKVQITAEKLLYEVGRLRRDVEKLHTRVDPFENEREFSPIKAEPIQSLAESLNALVDARNSVQGAEYHLAAIRAAMDGIAKDAISREEMKPYLKE